jgi:biopolymer transport protein ExbB/TolQ
METGNSGIVQTILDLPIFEAEWVLWLLLGLSLVSVVVMVERIWFYQQHSIDITRVRDVFKKHLTKGEYAKAARFLESFDALETNVALAGLREYTKGPDSVEEAIVGAMSVETNRFQKRLSFLATIGSNAPFIGLFGTVLGVIKSFAELGDDFGSGGGGLMEGISEALVATGVGLLVAIPAVIAYNAFAAKMKALSANTDLLSRTLLVELKAINPPKEVA